MAVNSVTSRPNNTKPPLAVTIATQAVSAACGYVAAKSTAALADTAKIPLTYQLAKNGNLATEHENRKLFEAFDKMLTQSGLKLNKIKVQIFNKSSLDLPEIRKKCHKAIELDKQLKPSIPNEIFRNMLVSDKTKSHLYSFITGVNAAYNGATNTIKFADNFVAAAPHEAGHAVIANSKNIGKWIDDARYLILRGKIIRTALILGLLTRKHKQEDGKRLTFTQKTENAVHDNLGWIVSALTLPTLINEYQASHISEKYMKKFLPKNLYSKVVKNNRLGLSTYIVSTLALGPCAALGVKVKDKISEKIQSKLAERQAKQTQKTS